MKAKMAPVETAEAVALAVFIAIFCNIGLFLAFGMGRLSPVQAQCIVIDNISDFFQRQRRDPTAEIRWHSKWKFLGISFIE